MPLGLVLGQPPMSHSRAKKLYQSILNPFIVCCIFLIQYDSTHINCRVVAMLWLKTFHILFVMSWMAGIFYLPRIFVHFVEGKQAGQQVDRLAIMARKLYGFMTIMMVVAVATGL